MANIKCIKCDKVLLTSNGEISIFGSLIDARSFASIGHVKDSKMEDCGDFSLSELKELLEAM